VAADEIGGEPLGRAAGVRHELPDPRSERGLVDTRPRDRARERDERRAGLAERAELAEPRWPVARDERDLGERLDVLDERRPAAPTAAAASAAPSSTRCGTEPSRALSLRLTGSPSVPFATT